MVNQVYQAHTMEEALNWLDQHKEKAKLIAGGTDLIIKLREGGMMPAVLIDISNMQDTKHIEERDQRIILGSTATFTDIQQSQIFQKRLIAIAQAAQSVGSPQIRHRATVGGNICNASPAADLLPPLLAMNTKALLQSKEASRLLPLEELLTGKETTCLLPEEMLKSIEFSSLGKGEGLGFSKLSVRNALAIARISMAVYLQLDDKGNCRDIRIASGALGLKAQREKNVESLVKDQPLDKKMIETASKALETNTLERLAGRKTLPFKRYAVQGVFQEALEQAMELCVRRDI